MVVKQLFESITFEKARDTLSELVKTPSVSKSEGQLAELLMKKCKAMGYEASIDRHGNMIAGKKYGEPGIKFVLNSHMDTVDTSDNWKEQPWGARVDGDILYGLGSCDCKSSIAAMLLAMEAIAKSGLELKGELCFTAVVQEEVQGEKNKGTWKMIQDGFKADMVLIGEPTGLDICRGCTGMVEVEITTEGVPAHGSNPEKGVNAIQNMIRIIGEINKIKPGVSDLLGSGAINVGVINGGLRSSVVPDRCKLKIGRFVIEGESGPKFMREINAIIEKLKADDKKFVASAELIYDSAAGVVPEDTKLVQLLKEATLELNDKQAPVIGSRAHFDSDFLINLAQIPCVTLGPGDISLAHQADEHVPISEVVEAAKIYILTIIKALS